MPCVKPLYNIHSTLCLVLYETNETNLALTSWEPATRTQDHDDFNKEVRLCEPSRTSLMEMKIKYPIKLTNF